jgi:hypothetical protein
MDRGIVGVLLGMKVARSLPEGTPCVRANGEAAIVRHVKRSRNDRRRRRGGSDLPRTPTKGEKGNSVPKREPTAVPPKASARQAFWANLWDRLPSG